MTDAALGLGINWLGWALCVTSTGQWEDTQRDKRVPQQPSLVKGGTGKSLSSQAWLKEVLMSLQSDSKGVAAMLVTIHCFSGHIIISCVFIHFKKLALL